jgi:hypothetical protein
LCLTSRGSVRSRLETIALSTVRGWPWPK